MRHRPDFLPIGLPRALILLATLAGAAAGPVPTAAALDAEIAAKGARAVVARLAAKGPTAGGPTAGGPTASGPTDWDRVIDQMWMGRAAYIALAPLLAPGTDAATAEGLGIALAHALPLAPLPVLRAIDPNDGTTLGASRVCGVPFIEDTVKDLPAYIRAAQAAVTRVSAPALQAARTACLLRLAATAKLLPPE